VRKDFDFKRELLSGCESLGLVEPDRAAMERLHCYYLELKKWSRKVNLIAKGTGDVEIVEKHFLDSLTLLPILSGENPHLLDIGTGAGLPGLVCKAVLPELKVTLVEPRLRRVSFLRHIIRTLKLESISVLECRAEDEDMLPTDGGFTHITSRAVSEIRLFLAMCNRFAAADTQVICMKGPRWREEMDSLTASDSEKIFRLASTTEYILPESKSTRNVMVFDSTHK
jgi:16S rRNA (guanine527-N7)-methyltransferase